METVLELDAVTKHFGEVVANDEVSLRVGRGEVVGLLGHNGAGKTTLVSQVVGLLRPDAGSIVVSGVDAVRHPAEARRHLALQSQSHAPIEGLDPRTAIELAGRLRGLSESQASVATRTIAEELDIGAWMDRRALPDGRGLSGGIRRLTAFAMAAIAATPLLVLDEPTNDIDPARRRRLWEAVRRFADRGGGVLLVTHNVAEAEQVVDRLTVLDHGRVVADGTPTQLRGDAREVVRLELHRHPATSHPDAATLELPIPVARRVTAGRRLLFTIRPEQAADAVVWAMHQRESGTIAGYTLGPVTLEDTYLALTTDPSPGRPDQEAVPPRPGRQRGAQPAATVNQA